MYSKIIIFVVNILLCPTALFGNSMTLFAIWKTSSLHSPASSLLSSLAVSDFAVGLISHPLFIARLASEIHDVSNNLFVPFNILTIFLCSASFLTITAIGVDRLLALQLHLRYVSVVTQFRVSCVIILIWVFSAFASSLQIWFSYLFAIILAPMLVILLVINFAFYLRIYLIVRRHQTQIHQQQQAYANGNILSLKRFKRSAVNTFFVYILLLPCYAPFVVNILFRGWDIQSSVLNATGTIILLNSSLNPLLYCWRIREIRSAIKNISCCT